MLTRDVIPFRTFMLIGYCSSPRFVEHETGPHHPERPDRIRAIARAVRQAGLVQSPDPFPDFKIDLGPMDGRGVVVKELDCAPADEKWLRSVHTERYVEHVKHVCAAGGGVLDLGDTVVGPRSHEIAMLAVGAVLRCCDAVMIGEVSRAFAAVRPPGHHAEPRHPMGFCLFSNVAIAARYIQRTYNVERVAIVDFDVHHGNGTQAAFEEDPSVLFISMHQHPRTLYPGSGHDWEIGVGAARGTIINIPFEPGSGDEEYLAAMDGRVVPALEAFGPQVLLISAGFDAHAEDPLADGHLTEAGYEALTRRLVAAAERVCGGRVVSVLEGGYNLRALGRSVVRHLLGLAGAPEGGGGAGVP